MSLGLTIPSRARAADSIVVGSLPMRRISICKAVFDRCMEAISDLIRLYSDVDALNSAFERTITVAQIPRVAKSIIARKTQEGISRNQPSVAGNKSRESSRMGNVGIACAVTLWVNCRLLSQ
jgi:hypothetical protein